MHGYLLNSSIVFHAVAMLVNILDNRDSSLLVKTKLKIVCRSNDAISDIPKDFISLRKALSCRVCYRFCDAIFLTISLLLFVIHCRILIKQTAFIGFVDFLSIDGWIVHPCINLLLQHRVIPVNLAGIDYLSVQVIVLTFLFRFDHHLHHGSLLRRT